MFLFGLTGLLYIAVLLLNAIAILSEDRFLARIGWTSAPQTPGFGVVNDTTGLKHQTIKLIESVRTLMRPILIPINVTIIAYELIAG